MKARAPVLRSTRGKYETVELDLDEPPEGARCGGGVY